MSLPLATSSVPQMQPSECSDDQTQFLTLLRSVVATKATHWSCVWRAARKQQKQYEFNLLQTAINPLTIQYSAIFSYCGDFGDFLSDQRASRNMSIAIVCVVLFSDERCACFLRYKAIFINQKFLQIYLFTLELFVVVVVDPLIFSHHISLLCLFIPNTIALCSILLFRLLFASAFSHVLLSDSRYLYEKCTLLSVCLIRIVVGNRTKDIYTQYISSYYFLSLLAKY